MSLPAAVVDLIHSALPALTPQAAAMPTPTDFLFDSDQVTPFGLSGDFGQRRFQTGLDIALGPTGAIPLRAMFAGQISRVGQNIALDLPHADGTRVITQRPGLLLKVNPRAGFQRALLENPDCPLEYPVPFWVVYEGAEPDPALTDQSPLERFATVDFFAFDSAALPAGSANLLDSIAADLLVGSNLKVRLEGHTDAEGDSNYNLNLGRQRAEAVRDYLQGQGVPQDRMIVDTEGEGQPKDPNPPDTAAAGINRRVEIHVLASFTHTVEAGDSIGSAPDGVTITVLDPLSHYLDPLNLVLRLQSNLNDHPLAAHADPLAPAVASNWVRCVSLDPASDSPDRPFPYFSFHNSLAEALNAAQDNDIIWLDTPSHAVNLTIDRPLSLIGKPGAGDARPELSPASDGSPILSATVSAGSSEYGLRVLGCTFRDGTADDGGAGMRLAGLKNVHIAHCQFRFNVAGPTFNTPVGNGGAIRMEDCHKVLVESCCFRFNSAKRGGAMYAENCRDVVVTGTPSPHLDALLASETEIPSFTLPDSFPGDVAGIPPALIGQGFSTFFHGNGHKEAGAAICLTNCTFRIRHAYFASSSNTEGYGGALAMRTYATDIQDIENEILGCVAVANAALDGGAFAALGDNDGAAARAGLPHALSGGGGRYRIVRNAIHGNASNRHGGGLYLALGAFFLQGNRIAQNTAFRNGGGIACFSRCRAEFVDNLILRNEITRADTDKPPGGGGGIYATFWTGQDFTEIRLVGNKVIGNRSTEDGGGLRATCGVRVELSTGNEFVQNVAYRNGGGISVRNAHLSIIGGNLFDGNLTQDGGPLYYHGGDGGGIHCTGSLPSPDFPDMYVFGTCTLDGARLAIVGFQFGQLNLVRFVNNQAVKQGGALYIQQETSGPVGELKEVYIEHTEFDNNLSSSELPSNSSLKGSTILIQGITTWASTAGSNGNFVLKNISIKLSQGVGLYLIHSDGDVERTENVNFVHLPGATAVQDEFVYNP